MARPDEAFHHELTDIDLGDLVDNLLAPGHAAAIRSEAMCMDHSDLSQVICEEPFTPAFC